MNFANFRNLVLGAVLSMAAFSPPVLGQGASEASIRDLMEITNSRSLLENTYRQVEGITEQAMKDALAGKPVSAEQEKLMAELRTEMGKVIREEMSWQVLEPGYLKLYGDTFSQAELDGMIAFYKSDAGKAVIGKMPALMQNLMQMMMTRMQAVMPKFNKLQQEYVAKLKAADEESGQ